MQSQESKHIQFYDNNTLVKLRTPLGMILLRHHHQSATGQRPSKLHPQNHIKETAGMQYVCTDESSRRR